MEQRLIPIGKIEAIHGVKGAVKARTLSDFPQRFASLSSVYVMKNGSAKELSIAHSRPHRNGALITFTDIHQADDAKQLQGAMICIREDEMLSPPPDTYYIHDLIGYDIYDETNDRLGELKEVWQLPANDVFVVRDGTRETLFPAIKDAVKSISPKSRRIMVAREFGVD